MLALKMTFYPVEFMGIKIWQPEDQPLGCIGWQVQRGPCILVLLKFHSAAAGTCSPGTFDSASLFFGYVFFHRLDRSRGAFAMYRIVIILGHFDRNIFGGYVLLFLCFLACIYNLRPQESVASHQFGSFWSTERVHT